MVVLRNLHRRPNSSITAIVNMDLEQFNRIIISLGTKDGRGFRTKNRGKINFAEAVADPRDVGKAHSMGNADER